jgi:hypothetical protein
LWWRNKVEAEAHVVLVLVSILRWGRLLIGVFVGR